LLFSSRAVPGRSNVAAVTACHPPESVVCTKADHIRFHVRFVAHISLSLAATEPPALGATRTRPRTRHSHAHDTLCVRVFRQHRQHNLCSRARCTRRPGMASARPPSTERSVCTVSRKRLPTPRGGGGRRGERPPSDGERYAEVASKRRWRAGPRRQGRQSGRARRRRGARARGSR